MKRSVPVLDMIFPSLPNISTNSCSSEYVVVQPRRVLAGSMNRPRHRGGTCRRRVLPIFPCPLPPIVPHGYGRPRDRSRRRRGRSIAPDIDAPTTTPHSHEALRDPPAASERRPIRVPSSNSSQNRRMKKSSQHPHAATSQTHEAPTPFAKPASRIVPTDATGHTQVTMRRAARAGIAGLARPAMVPFASRFIVMNCQHRDCTGFSMTQRPLQKNTFETSYAVLGNLTLVLCELRVSGMRHPFPQCGALCQMARQPGFLVEKSKLGRIRRDARQGCAGDYVDRPTFCRLSFRYVNQLINTELGFHDYDV
ncbi:hypothetical protein [Burkholderia gladioli]|uniref:hypothetical protein n=1 Tax=Burkholderia gladioli TaxID=28095 RepID=UPI00163E3EA0|nr:hypothetical protein [Burkholderia gladioli]